MRYVIDDQTFEVKSAAELVRQMHNTSFAPAENDRAFMEEYAKRIFIQTQKKIRFDKATNFVADMIEAGLIKQVETARK